jgi:hypothetical protein
MVSAYFAGSSPEWCLLRDNPKLRRLVEFRLRQLGITNILAELKLDKRNVYRFLKGDTKEISQLQYMKIITRVGVEIKFDFDVKV